VAETIWFCDPGGTTGWSLWAFPDTSPAMRLEYGAVKSGVEGFLTWSERTLGVLRPDAIVFERFNPDLGYGKSKDYEALEIQGVVRAVARALGIDLIFQDTDMKAMCSDADLKRLGFYIEPAQARVDPAIMHVDARDVNDSQIHAMAFAKATDHAPTIEAFWPPITLA
jgi:hypothetical protein